MPRSCFWIALVAAALSACAPLTAEAPLFSPADQVGPAPLAEGVWITISEDCPRRNARRRGRLPQKCLPVDLHRLPDGAWIYRYQDHVRMENEEGETEMPRSWRLIIAPATERQPADSFVPLYLAEYLPLEEAEETAGPHYAAIAPIGPLPAREFWIETEIDCQDILRDGPIAGITAERGDRFPPPASPEAVEETAVAPPSASQPQQTDDDGRDIVRCVASTKPAVREAVRRAAIENLNDMLGDGGARLVFVRP